VSPRKTLACLSFVLLFVCAGSVARADTIVLQNVSGVMTYTDFPMGDDSAGLTVAANDFSAGARNLEVFSPGGFHGNVGGNTVIDRFGASTYMGQEHLDFGWGATFDGVNVTGSVRWVDQFNPLQTIHTFTFTGAGTLTTEVPAGGATRYTVSFAGPAQSAATPEPATLSLFGAGLAGRGFAARSRRAARKNIHA
jgi:hypothetical protein